MSHGKITDSFKNKQSKNNVEVDMNPMTDLAFLLLTFFMLATTFSKPQAMELVLPEKVDHNNEKLEHPVKESQALTLLLHGDDELYYYLGITDPKLEKVKYGPDGIRKLLMQKNSEIDKMVILIKPTDKCKYENLVDVLDEMNICDIQRYAIVDVTDFDLNLIDENNG